MNELTYPNEQKQKNEARKNLAFYKFLVVILVLTKFSSFGLAYFIDSTEPLSSTPPAYDITSPFEVEVQDPPSLASAEHIVSELQVLNTIEKMSLLLTEHLNNLRTLRAYLDQQGQNLDNPSREILLSYIDLLTQTEVDTLSDLRPNQELIDQVSIQYRQLMLNCLAADTYTLFGEELGVAAPTLSTQIFIPDSKGYIIYPNPISLVTVAAFKAEQERILERTGDQLEKNEVTWRMFDWERGFRFFYIDQTNRVVYASSWQLLEEFYNDNLPTNYDKDGFSQLTEYEADGYSWKIGEGFLLEASQARGEFLFQEFIVQNWDTILEASQETQTDPFLIAALIFTELTDQLDSKINPDFKVEVDRNLIDVPRLKVRLAQLFLGETYTETEIDLLGAVANRDTSVGPSQINISTAREGLVALPLNRMAGPDTPAAVIALALQSAETSIMATARYLQQVQITFSDIEAEQLNGYYPNLEAYTPRPVGNGYFLLPAVADKHNVFNNTEVPAYLWGVWYTSPAPFKEIPGYPLDISGLYQRVLQPIHSDWGARVEANYSNMIMSAERLGTTATELRASYEENIQTQLESLHEN